MVEEDSLMYGGTCINVACIPTKTLVQAVKSGKSFDEAFEYRDEVTEKLHHRNYDKLATNESVDIYTGHATFVDTYTIKVAVEEETIDLIAEKVIINTGSVPNFPQINGLESTNNVFDSTSLQTLRKQPHTLGIIGAGRIGLEFASLYVNMGTKVYVFNRGSSILDSEEAELVEMVEKYLKEDGVEFISNFDTESLSNDQAVKVVLKANTQEFSVDALLIATGRSANTINLGLENTDIELDDKGYIKVNEYLETSASGIYAVGDINGGLQFTYISLDDYRIVKDHLEGKKNYSLNDRKNVPYTYFLNPSYSRVGLTEAEAKEKGKKVKVNLLDVASMPRAHVNNDLRGSFKVVIDDESDLILGASLLGKSAEELINLIKMAMDHEIPYTYFKNQIFTHPSMAENFNDIFNIK